jgi:hypothetical protein
MFPSTGSGNKSVFELIETTDFSAKIHYLGERKKESLFL